MTNEVTNQAVPSTQEVHSEQVTPSESAPQQQETVSSSPESVGTTVSLNAVSTPAPTSDKQPGFFERGVKNIVGFIAKATGQPDPLASTAQTTSGDGTIPNTAPAEKSGFFQKLVHSTQNLLNKVDTVAQKTQTITQSIREAPNQLAEKTNAAIGKGIDLGKNLQTSVTEGASQLTQDPLAATQNLGKGLVDSTTSLGKDIGQGAQQLGGQVVSVAPAQSSGTAENGGLVGGITHLGGKLLTQGQSALQQGVDMGKDLQNKVTTTVENQLPSGQNPSLEASASLPQEATSSPDQASSPVLAEGSASPSEEVPIPEGNVVSSSAVDSVSMQAFQPSTPVVQPETESVSSVQSETDSASSAQVPQEETKPSGLLGSLQQIGANLTDKTKDLGASVVAKTGHFLNDPVGQLDTLAGAGVQNSTVLPEETENTVSLDHLEEK